MDDKLTKKTLIEKIFQDNPIDYLIDNTLLTAKEAKEIALNSTDEILKKELNGLEDYLIQRINRHCRKGETKLTHYINYSYVIDELFREELLKIGSKFIDNGYKFNFQTTKQTEVFNTITLYISWE